MKGYIFFFCASILVLCGCKSGGQNTGPKYGQGPLSNDVLHYHFAVHPLHSPAKLMESYQPLVDYLNTNLKGYRFQLEASKDYAYFEEKYKNSNPEIILPNPWQTLEAMKAGYSVIAMAGEAKDFKGLFIVRKDSGIKTPLDLKGKAVSYPSPTALAACIMPQYFLYRNGINVGSDIENRYVGSQESSIMNVYLKLTAAGATWPPPWRSFVKDHPTEASELKVIWETEPLINNSVMVRKDLSEDLKKRIQALLTNLHLTTEGQAILSGMETARFFAANDNTYEVVRNYVRQFETEVRKVESK